MDKIINVSYIARVEGEGAITVKVPKNLKGLELKLKIWEPPRFFEGFLVGRRCDEVADIVARICGICPVSHMITALRAMENAMGINPSEQTKILRRLMSLSQIAASHLIHLYMLAMPDYFGHEGITEMIPHFQEEIKRLMRMKKVINDLTAAIGGRALHPISAVLGGFTNLPLREELDGLCQKLKEIKDDAKETVRMAASFAFPEFEEKREYVGLRHPDRYAINEGRIASTQGLDVSEGEYSNCFEEEQVSYAMAKRSKVKGRGPFMVGALARLNLKFDQLSKETKALAEEINFTIPHNNPFHNNIAQALEVAHIVDECIEILEGLKLKEEKEKEGGFAIRPGAGGALTEAPRGLLYHWYEVNKRGVIERVNIVTPTSHNFSMIEQDIHDLAAKFAELSQGELARKCEMLIRAYDPCFSCSVH
jgi:coenzyme F420-reducing hydrogenase alpha subunit